MRRIEIEPGKRYGKWTVGECAGIKNKAVCFSCVCECGACHEVRGSCLLNGSSQECKQCGATKGVEANTKHGLSPRLGNDGTNRTKIYRAWRGMQDRCCNPKNKDYHKYGGRGITVCKEWRESPARFAQDMGEPPSPRHSLDRIDVNGNYEPGNCRWATPLVQQNNRRCTPPEKRM